MSQIALNRLYIIPVLQGQNSEGMADTVDFPGSAGDTQQGRAAAQRQC